MGADTQIIPSISVSERYDSNVFFGLAGPGVDPADYVTNVSPRVRVANETRLVNATVQGGLFAERYINHPGLSYVGGDGAAFVNLDHAVEQIVRGAGLQLSDYVSYTPQPPAFLSPEATGQVSDAFVRGIQALRANSLTNTASANGFYAVSPSTRFQGGYSYSFMQFGNAVSTTPVAGTLVPKTTIETANAGLQVQASPTDKVGSTYVYQKGGYSQDLSAFNFETHGMTLNWMRNLTPSLTTNLSGGPVLISPGKQVNYLGAASLEWKAGGSSAMVSYARAVFPNFYTLAAGAFISQTVSVSFTRALSDRLTMTGNGNYNISEPSSGPSFRFVGYGAGLSFNYLITRILTGSLSYGYNDFKQESEAEVFAFDRHIATISLRAEWK